MCNVDFTNNAPTPQPKPKKRLLTLSELSNRPKPRYLVQNLLIEGGTSLFSGAHASFKSFLALDIALSVATGANALGFATRQGKAVYIAAEGVQSLYERVDAWLEYKQLPLPEHGFYVYDEPIQLSDRQELAETIELAEHAAIIVIDTLARCTLGLEENSSNEMGLFIESATQLAKATKAHVLIIHHNNKNGTSRGSTALPAAVDTVVAVDRENMGKLVTVKVQKQKDGEEIEPFILKATPSKDSIVLTNAPTRLEENIAQALKALTHPMTSNEWRDATKIPSNAFYDAQAALLANNQVVSDKPHGKKGAKYQITL